MLRVGKPLFHLAYVSNLGIVPNERMEEFRYWLERYNIHVLNVALAIRNPAVPVFKSQRGRFCLPQWA